MLRLPNVAYVFRFRLIRTIKTASVAKLAHVIALSLIVNFGAAHSQTSVPSPKTPSPSVSGVTSRTVSFLAVELSSTVPGQIITCPPALGTSDVAVCLYIQDLSLIHI